MVTSTRKSISSLTVNLKVYFIFRLFFTPNFLIFSMRSKKVFMNTNFKLHFLFNYRMRHIFIIQKRFSYLLIIFQFHIYIHFQWSLKNIYEQ